MQVVMPIITLLVGAVLGAVLGRWYGVYQSRPMLTIIGSGDGAGPGSQRGPHCGVRSQGRETGKRRWSELILTG